MWAWLAARKQYSGHNLDSPLVTLAGGLPGTPGVEGGRSEAQDGEDEARIPTPAPGALCLWSLLL